jgi:subtilisin family serine protease
VQYALDGFHQRSEYHWFITNSTQPSVLYTYSTNPVSQITGTNDANILNAWGVQSNSTVTVTVADQAILHGFRCRELVELVSRGQSTLANMLRVYPDTIAAVITNAVDSGSKIVVVPSIVPGNYTPLSNACQYALYSNVLIVCSVPDSSVNIDTSPDYPSSWAEILPNVVPVTMTDRNGNLWAAAWGTNVVGAPGQYIVAYSTYSSGSSYGGPIVAGSLALLVSRFPGQTAEAYRQALWESSVRVGLIRRLDALRLVDQPRPSLLIAGTNMVVSGLPLWRYTLEYSPDLVAWSVHGHVSDGDVVAIPEGFSRLRVVGDK